MQTAGAKPFGVLVPYGARTGYNQVGLEISSVDIETNPYKSSTEDRRAFVLRSIKRRVGLMDYDITQRVCTGNQRFPGRHLREMDYEVPQSPPATRSPGRHLGEIDYDAPQSPPAARSPDRHLRKIDSAKSPPATRAPGRSLREFGIKGVLTERLVTGFIIVALNKCTNALAYSPVIQLERVQKPGIDVDCQSLLKRNGIEPDPRDKPRAKKQFHRWALKNHPDRSGRVDSNDEFANMKHCYDQFLEFGPGEESISGEANLLRCEDFADLLRGNAEERGSLQKKFGLLLSRLQTSGRGRHGGGNAEFCDEVRLERPSDMRPVDLELNDVSIVPVFQEAEVRAICGIARLLVESNDSDIVDGDSEAFCDELFDRYAHEASRDATGLGVEACGRRRLEKALRIAQRRLAPIKASREYSSLVADPGYVLLRDRSGAHGIPFKAPQTLAKYDPGMARKIKLLQQSINRILAASGHGEDPFMDLGTYPRVSAIEVLDVQNTIWVQRIDSYLRPHGGPGLRGEGAGRFAQTSLGLPRCHGSLHWLRSIAHVLQTMERPGRNDRKLWLDLMENLTLLARVSGRALDGVYFVLFDGIFYPGSRDNPPTSAKRESAVKRWVENDNPGVRSKAYDGAAWYEKRFLDYLLVKEWAMTAS